MNKVKLFVNENTKSKKIAEIVKQELIKEQFILCDDFYEIAIAIGGDGAFLRMVKETNFNSRCLYIGINTGTLGFAQEIDEEEIPQLIKSLKNNSYKVEEIGVGEIEIITQDTISRQLTLNELVVRELELNTVNLKISIENQLLEKFVGDGLLVATSFGSTAYNLSFGGSVVYNTFHTLQLTPIAPLNNKTYRNLLNSLIIPANKEIKIEPFNRTKDLLITIDGDNNAYQQVKEIKVVIDKKTIRLYRSNDYNFIKKINDKFLK